MNNKIKKVCGMCKHSRPHPESKRVFCGRYPPTIQIQIAKNPITNETGTLQTSMLPDVLKDIVCGEFEFENAGIEKICKS